MKRVIRDTRGISAIRAATVIGGIPDDLVTFGRNVGFKPTSAPYQAWKHDVSGITDRDIARSMSEDCHKPARTGGFVGAGRRYATDPANRVSGKDHGPTPHAETVTYSAGSDHTGAAPMRPCVVVQSRKTEDAVLTPAKRVSVGSGHSARTVSARAALPPRETVRLPAAEREQYRVREPERFVVRPEPAGTVHPRETLDHWLSRMPWADIVIPKEDGR